MVLYPQLSYSFPLDEVASYARSENTFCINMILGIAEKENSYLKEHTEEHGLQFPLLIHQFPYLHCNSVIKKISVPQFLLHPVPVRES